MLVVVAGAVVLGHSFRLSLQAVTIPTSQGDLEGVLAFPEDAAARGLVVMVHGDGPVDATQDDLYLPWFEAAAEAGYATLSWSKPGVDGSAGDWLDQSMADRAREVDEVLDWATRRSDLPTGTVVLWGASQAGWVVPRVVADREDVDGVIAVGTAIDWQRQGGYHLEATLEHEGADAEERASALAERERVQDLLDRRATHAEYLAVTADADPMTADRWGFVLRNHGSDASADLEAASARGIPWHLMAGREDRNVDVAETEQVYREVLGDHLTVSWFDAAHSMARPVMEDVEPIGLATAVLAPRSLMAPGVLDDYQRTLGRMG